jgi:hypothetical protein
VRDRIEPKRDPSDAAYDEFFRTGTKEALARLLELREGFQVPTALLFFSGKAANKPVERVGLAASGAVIWSPEDFPDYSPEFGEWEPIAWDHFFSLSKGVLKRCYDKQLKALDEQLKSLGKRRKALDQQHDEKLNALMRQISDLKEEVATEVKEKAPTEVAASQTELLGVGAVWAALKNHKLSCDKALTIVREIFAKQQKKVHEQFDDQQQRVREQIDKLLKMDLKEYRSQLQRKIKAESIWDSLFLFLFSVRYPDDYAEYAKLQLTLSENGCKEKREKATVRKRRSQPRDKAGKYTKRKS